MSGTLVVVATPIGNLGDLSPRAAEALSTVDLVLAEDTRRTGRLLQHVGSQVPQRSLHEHNERERIGEIVQRLQAGERIALVSDAGTPAVSDPGYRLLAAVAEAGLTIEVVPGPSAALTALVASALPTDRVAFEGFLPRKGTARRERLEELRTERRTMVLFVSPHRADADLADLAAVLGADRPAALTRELTKLHEEVLRAPLGELAERVGRDGVRGEVTLVVGGAPAAAPAEVGDDDLVARVRGLVATGMDKKAAIAEVAATAAVPKKVVYQAVVDAGS
ncbi:MAG TPA: 16S rRNA (cytidine(1402)-2'-O)-methyltransferase [Egicoccus sp.]|nr:16S rRNA (cytidine(1402)-2'-O)-methyltransferase [Egicoccus sp.]HSK22531.1 16S rRNA (cytidine(1402)-2'-O)-methyltransferase [Egicoccus sp.]